MPRMLPLDRFHVLLATALENGARRHSVYRTKWSISGDCYSPYITEVLGRPERMPGQPKTIIVGPGRPTPMALEIDTRCRRCERCLRARYRRWSGAAIRETKASSRTWFGTLTLNPQEQFRFQAIASARLASQGVDFDRLDERERFAERCRAIAPELTKYIKRFRKGKTGMRYLLVAEKHESGDPHFHMLVHEAPLGGIVTHRELSSKWNLGFERWRLIDPHNPKSAAYLCKYLTKTLETRVRASQGYGVTTSKLHAYVIDRLLSIDREIPSEPEW